VRRRQYKEALVHLAQALELKPDHGACGSRAASGARGARPDESRRRHDDSMFVKATSSSGGFIFLPRFFAFLLFTQLRLIPHGWRGNPTDKKNTGHDEPLKYFIRGIATPSVGTSFLPLQVNWGLSQLDSRALIAPPFAPRKPRLFRGGEKATISKRQREFVSLKKRYSVSVFDPWSIRG